MHALLQQRGHRAVHAHGEVEFVVVAGRVGAQLDEVAGLVVLGEPLAQRARGLGLLPVDSFDAVVRGMTDHRSNAFVEAMNGVLQQAKRAGQQVGPELQQQARDQALIGTPPGPVASALLLALAEWI